MAKNVSRFRSNRCVPLLLLLLLVVVLIVVVILSLSHVVEVLLG